MRIIGCKGVLYMYTYSVFCVKADVANNYFYKTGILYRFLKEFRENRNCTYLQLQYKYITELLTLETISSFIQNFKSEITIEKRDSHMKFYWQDKQLTVYEDDRHIEFTCESLQDAEDFFFPVLRNLPLHFFITRNSMRDYGWLSFVKSKSIENRQILYSFH